MLRIALIGVVAILTSVNCGRHDDIHDGAGVGPWRFRALAESDLCQSVAIYVKPDRSYFLGLVFAEVDKVYSDGETFEDVIALNGQVNKSYRTIFRRREDLVGLFVREDDVSLSPCQKYSLEFDVEVSDEEVSPTQELINNGPGHWKTE